MGYYDVTVVSLDDKAKANLTSCIQEVGGKIIKQVDIGVKTFVYPIKKQKEGYFSAFVIECEEEKIKSLSDKIAVSKDTLRHLVIKSDAQGSTLSYGEKLQESVKPEYKENEAIKPKKIELKLDKEFAEKTLEPVKPEREKSAKKEAAISKKVYAEELRRSQENKKTLDEKLDEILKG